MASRETVTVNAGFLPLLDASLLIVARELGFCEDEGIDLRLHRETSWASIRDRLAVGHFDAAHLLAPMPIAAALTGGPMDTRLIVPMALGLGGNAVTVSRALWAKMLGHGAQETAEALINGHALARVCAARRSAGDGRLRLGVVHRFSSHNMELRYWLAASGVMPDVDAEFVVVPPPFMTDALQSGQIDGFCVGEPWNALAVESGAGVIATTKSSIWRSSPEKVLGVSAAWAEDNSDALQCLIRALARASMWCGESSNDEDLAKLIAAPAYLDQPAERLFCGLSGRMPLIQGGDVRNIEDFLLFRDRAATFPWVSHALWFYTQMVRWGMFTHSAEAVAIARATYRPDIYRQSLTGTEMSVPNASLKVEGALPETIDVPTTQGRLALGPDGFFDGRSFDPDLVDAYIDETVRK
jgi:NitT/TauT family transport system ATP-binding protein